MMEMTRNKIVGCNCKSKLVELNTKRHTIASFLILREKTRLEFVLHSSKDVEISNLYWIGKELERNNI